MKQFADTMAQNKQTDRRTPSQLFICISNAILINWIGQRKQDAWAEKQDFGWYLPAKSKADLNTARCSMQKEATVERNIGSREQK